MWATRFLFHIGCHRPLVDVGHPEERGRRRSEVEREGDKKREGEGERGE